MYSAPQSYGQFFITPEFQEYLEKNGIFVEPEQVRAGKNNQTKMSTVCKMKISQIEKGEAHDFKKGCDAPVYSLSAYPVYTGSEENESFFCNTPSGELKLNIVNKAAVEHFKVGDEIYVTLTKAES